MLGIVLKHLVMGLLRSVIDTGSGVGSLLSAALGGSDEWQIDVHEG